jgi:hypothetical protein
MLYSAILVVKVKVQKPSDYYDLVDFCREIDHR